MPRGQSPVSGIVLLVVLLVVVLGTIALLAGPFASVLSEPPRVSLDTTQNVGASPAEAEASVTFAHDGGDALPAEDVYVVVNGDRAATRENLTLRYSASTFEIGERIVIEQDAPGGFTGDERLTLIYQRGDTEYSLRSVTVRGENGT